MEFDWHGELYIPPGGPPQVAPPSRDIYAEMGQEGIERMIHDFYQELEKSSLRPLFPDDIEDAARKSALYFVGLLGGPPVYQELYGHPMMRRRHLAFPISDEARRTWLDCFNRVLDHAPASYGFPEQHLPGFKAFLEGFSSWMVNRK